MSGKPMLILRSDLTSPPRYYATRAYTVLGDKGHIRVTGKKWDVTEQIEQLLRDATVLEPDMKEKKCQ